mgnify:CR=1 FL=1
MTSDEMLRDMHALEEDLLTFERKYGVISEVFYEAYQQGEEPANDAWVLDWSEWAATYQLLQDRRQQYRAAVRRLLTQPAIPNISHLIERTARHEPLPVFA